MARNYPITCGGDCRDAVVGDSNNNTCVPRPIVAAMGGRAGDRYSIKLLSYWVGNGRTVGSRNDAVNMSTLPVFHFGTHVMQAASVVLSFGANTQVDRLKKLMVHAVARKDSGHWLCNIGLHSMVWNAQLHIGRKAGPWSRYRLHFFQLGFCQRCGRAKQRWIGEAPKE
jgi:hypothetical protein